MQYCEEKGLSYTLIKSPDYASFIKQLSQHQKYLYFPKVLETFNRVIIEARMLNCKINTTANNGCLSEDWFKKYKGKELIEFVREQRQRVFNDIKEAIYKERFSYYDLINGLYIEKKLHVIIKNNLKSIFCMNNNSMYLPNQFIYLILLNMKYHKRNILKYSDVLEVNLKLNEMLGIKL